MTQPTEKTSVVTYYIGRQADPEKRTKLAVTAEGLSDCPPRGTRQHGTITDVNGKTYKVKRVSCGLPRCFCALDFVQ